MAERRMFSKSIIDSDAFLDMTQTAQLLYFHLSMRADDDGFINNPKAIMRNVRCSEEDLRLLANKKFIIPFETGVVVIKHWKIHNYIRNDRYKETKYKEEKEQLFLDENNSYTVGIPNGNQMDTVGIPVVSKMDTQVRLGKDSIGKDNIVDSTSDEANAGKPAKSVKHKYGEYKNVLLTDDELNKLKERFIDYQERIERLSEYIASKGTKYKSHYATILSWARRENEKQTEKKTSNNKFINFEQRDTDYDKLIENYYGFG